MEEDIDIYADLPSFDPTCNANFDASNYQNDKIALEHVQLKAQIGELTATLEDFRKVNANLEVNLFSLLKTAKAEIARKDKMIGKLRKMLDDLTFRRGMYGRKTQEHVTRKSSCHENVGSGEDYEESANKFRSHPNERVEHDESVETDFSCTRRMKQPPRKCTLTPITVFGERLRKRIVEEECVERKDKRANKLKVLGESGLVSTEGGCVAESDKENGSLCHANSAKATEIQCPLAPAEPSWSDPEPAKIPITVHRTNDKTGGNSGLASKSTLYPKHVGKRGNEDTTRQQHVSAKRFKSERPPDSIKSPKQTNDNTNVQSKTQCHSSKYVERVEGSGSWSERVSANSKHAGAAELSKHRRYLASSEVLDKRDKSKESKEEKDALDEKKDGVNGRCQKRRVKAESSPSSRCINGFRRGGGGGGGGGGDDRRTNDVEHRRARQREVRDRSRGSYDREKYDRHAGYGERFEKRYDFRSTAGGDRSKAVNEESCDPWNPTRRHNTIKRKSSAEKTINGGRSSEYVTGKERGAAMKRDKKQADSGEQVLHRKSAGDKQLVERLTESKVRSRRPGEKGVDSGLIAGRVEKEQQQFLTIDEFQCPDVEIAGDLSICQLEDGEIASSPASRPEKNRRDASKERRNVPDDADFPFSPETMPTQMPTQMPTRMPEKSIETLKDVCETVTQSFDPMISVVDAASSDEQITIESGKNTVENVENIQQFIRDYPSNEKTLATGTTAVFKSVALAKEDEEPVGLGGDQQQEGGTILSANIENVSKLDDRTEKTNAHLQPISESNETQSRGSLSITTIPLESAKEDSIDDLYSDNTIKEATKFPVVLLELPRRSGDNNIDRDKDVRVENENENEIEIGNGGIKEKKKNTGKDDDTLGRTDQEKRDTGVGEAATYQGKDIGKESAEHEGGRSETGKKAEEKSMKDASLKVQRKILVFARRKKPVCLANNNASMTILVNKAYEVPSVDSSGLRDTIKRCNSVKKLRACRRSRRDERELVGS